METDSSTKRRKTNYFCFTRKGGSCGFGLLMILICAPIHFAFLCTVVYTVQGFFMAMLLPMLGVASIVLIYLNTWWKDSDSYEKILYLAQ
eukprot:SAG11_NODE_20943_length_435_cov_0.892857_2_plen_89_part_01